MSQLAVYSVLFSMMILCAHGVPVPSRRDTNEQCDRFYSKSSDLFNHLGSIENVSGHFKYTVVPIIMAFSSFRVPEFTV